ncbi:MAG: hypothetical protein GY838_16495 [bacterium]|nr:hypothetical protein [bacterium]
MRRTPRAVVAHVGLPLVLLALWSTAVCAQSLSAWLGVGRPDTSDGVFEGTLTDITPGSGEWGNFLFLDYEAADPAITLADVRVDFGPSVDADLESRGAVFADNLDGAAISNENVANNVYTGEFVGFDDDVDLFFIGFDFDKRSYSGGGTPLGADYVNATIVATLSNGVELTGTFDVVDFFIAVAQIGVPGGGDIDVWIRDCAADVGDVPSNGVCPQWYTSPDIFIDNNLDGLLDAPVYGEDNILRALVRNRGSGFAQDVTVDFYYRNNNTGLVFPDGATLIGSTSVDVPPNGLALCSVDWLGLAEAPSSGHWCIGVVLTHGEDPPITPPVIPYEDNNVGIANIWFIAGRAGERMSLSFDAGTGGRSGFGLAPWPRQFRLAIVDSLPDGWRWELEGAAADTPFALKLGEVRPVTLTVEPPADAAPHTGGVVEVRQVDVITGRVVGGVTYNVYEDHRPPEPVKGVFAELSSRGLVLNWDPVLREAGTGLPERLAYYEVAVDGKAVGKAFRDADPARPGFQWRPRVDAAEDARYTIVAVDEGGNRSERSEAVGRPIVDRECPLLNWLVWVLIVLIVLLILICLRRR